MQCESGIGKGEQCQFQADRTVLVCGEPFAQLCQHHAERFLRIINTEQTRRKSSLLQTKSWSFGEKIPMTTR